MLVNKVVTENFSQSFWLRILSCQPKRVRSLINVPSLAGITPAQAVPGRKPNLINRSLKEFVETMKRNFVILSVIVLALVASLSPVMAQEATEEPVFTCIISVIDNVVTRGACPEAALAATGQGGGLTPLAVPFDFMSEAYAAEAFDFGNGFHRVNAAFNGEYTSWWHQESLTTNRAVKPGEIVAEDALLWVFEPDDDDLTVQFTVQLSVEDILDWQSKDFPFQPYDAQRGMWIDRPADGENVALFLLGDATSLSINGSIPFDVSIDGCTDCDKPTFVVNPSTVNIPAEWFATESTRKVDHDAAITIPMVNNAAAVRAGTEQLVPVTIQFTVLKDTRFTVHAGAWTEVENAEALIVGDCTLTAVQNVNVRTEANLTAAIETVLVAGASLPVESQENDFYVVPGGYVSKNANVTLSEGCAG